MNVEAALPEVTEQVAGAGEQQTDAAPVEIQDEAQKPEGEGGEGEKKPERHPLEKELAKERRRIARLVEQREQARAEAAQLRQQQPPRLQSGENGDTLTSDERVTLTQAELNKLIREQAERLAPEVSSKREQEGELRAKALTLQKDLGGDFQTVTEDLAAILPSGDLQLAVLSADAPAELARYLTDPDNADEAERIGRMSPVMAGRAFAKIEAKLEAAKVSRPQPSRAAAPLEAVRGGSSSNQRDYNTLASDQAWFEARRKARAGR